MFHLWAKPRPLPPWAALLEHDTPVQARGQNPNGRRRRLGKRTEKSLPETPEETADRVLAGRETAERLNVSVGTADKWVSERWLP